VIDIGYVSLRAWDILVAERLTFLFLENNNHYTNITLGNNEGCKWKKIINTVLDKNVCSVWVEL